MQVLNQGIYASHKNRSPLVITHINRQRSVTTATQPNVQINEIQRIVISVVNQGAKYIQINKSMPLIIIDLQLLSLSPLVTLLLTTRLAEL